MIKIRWYVSTDKVGSKMTGEFQLDNEDYSRREDGTVELEERAVDESVLEIVMQRISYGWEIVDGDA